MRAFILPVKVEINGSEVWCKSSELEVGTNFYLKSDTSDNISVKIPLELDSSFKDKNFDLYFLAKKDIKESDIYQVYLNESDTRIGWLIPTISLVSTDHNYANDPHFLKYAYIGIRESLKNLDDSFYSLSVIGDTNEVFYDKIFHESTALLIVCKDTIVGGVQFDIDRACPSLIKHGYVRLGSITPDEIAFVADSPENEKLYIEQISRDIESEKLISELLNTSFAYEKKAIFKFFLLYQIIELLIDDIYKHEQESIIPELVSVKGDSARTKDILEKIQSVITEKKRITYLMQRYTNMTGNLSQLKSMCNSLLTTLGIEEGLEFQHYFYKIRNFIFHQYRDFPTDGVNILEEIIKEFLDLMPQILSKYKYPITNT